MMLAQNHAEGLTSAGLTLMIGCIVFVCALCIFCYSRVLRGTKPSDKNTKSE